MTTAILRGHLETEVKRLYVARRNSLITAIVVVLIVLGYTSWLYAMVRHFTKPDNLAMLVSGMVEAQIPGLKHSAASLIQAETPALAKHVGNMIRNDVPAQLRKLVDSAANDAANQVAKEASKTYTTALKAVVENAKAEVTEAVAAKTDDESRAALFVAVQKHMDKAMKEKEDSGLVSEGVFDKLQKAGDTLVRINKKLELYAGTNDKNLTAKDRKTKRFIGTFWRFVRQEYPDAKQGGAPDGKAK